MTLPRYMLANVEERHRENPDTFHLFPWRRRLEPGDHAKVIFERPDPLPCGAGGERMWLRIVEKKGGRYVGALLNTPVVVEGVKPGDLIEFGPEHVCDAHPAFTLKRIGRVTVVVLLVLGSFALFILLLSKLINLSG